MNNLRKMLIKLDPGDWHGHPIERVWIEPVSDEGKTPIFRVQSSPFFAKGLSYGDLVQARQSSERSDLEFERVISSGGHSTYMLLVNPDESRFEQYWAPLNRLGASYEQGAHLQTSMGMRIFYSVDVPTTSDLPTVYKLLEAGENDGVWLFQEGNVGKIS